MARGKKTDRTNRTRKSTKKDWTPAFLDELSSHANIKEACAAARVGRQTVYDRRNSDPAFAAEMARALEDATDILERETWRRAVEGVDRPVFQGGKQVGVVREYSDTLITLLLKAHKPDKYRDRQQIEHSGGTTVTHVYMPPNGREDEPPAG